MRITFYGAAQEVTGSMYLIEANGRRVLLECGLFQGHRSDTYERNLHFPFDPRTIDALVLSHAHIDHSGNIPNLVKQGFQGHIWCTGATSNLCSYMLMDSARIQESDVEYLNKKARRRGEPPVEPLYTTPDATVALRHFATINLHRTVTVADGIDLTFYNAGHILGSAFVVLDIREGAGDASRSGAAARDKSGSGAAARDKPLRLVFSGDIGREEAPILKTPEKLDAADIVLVESTYGDRLHGSYAQARRELRDTVRDTVRRRGKVVIPAFAVGRTQEIVYALNELEAEGDIPPVPIFVDSPLAVSATEVFRMHPEAWDEEVLAFLKEERRRNPFDSPQIEYVRDVRRSKQLNYLTQPAVIISASGMAEYGRILHHLQHNIEDPDNTILFVGFQAQNTLGRRLVDGERVARIFGEEHPVRAQIATIDGYSAHADQAELLGWMRPFDRARLKQVFVVHGEQASSFTFAEKLRGEGCSKLAVPEHGQSFEF
jgi:metallo-beta-lactamase family protein